MNSCTKHGTGLDEGEKCQPCEIEFDPEFVAEKIEDLETENAGCADRLEKCEKERDELKAENEKLRSQDSDNIRIVGAALRCFPEPASEMLDDQLEKPLVVVDRIRTENEMLLDSVKEAFLSGYSQGNHAAVESMGYSADESANEYMEDIENKTQEPE